MTRYVVTFLQTTKYGIEVHADDDDAAEKIALAKFSEAERAGALRRLDRQVYEAKITHVISERPDSPGANRA